MSTSGPRAASTAWPSMSSPRTTPPVWPPLSAAGTPEDLGEKAVDQAVDQGAGGGGRNPDATGRSLGQQGAQGGLADGVSPAARAAVTTAVVFDLLQGSAADGAGVRGVRSGSAGHPLLIGWWEASVELLFFLCCRLLLGSWPVREWRGRLGRPTFWST